MMGYFNIINLKIEMNSMFKFKKTKFSESTGKPSISLFSL